MHSGGLVNVTEKLRRLYENKTVRIIAVLILALILLIVVFRVFAVGEAGSDYTPTEREARLVRLIETLDEVTDATVMVTEEDGAAVGAVVIFRGEDGILTRMRILEIAAGALNIPKSAVIVYPAES